jgi:hypothetical protein
MDVLLRVGRHYFARLKSPHTARRRAIKLTAEANPLETCPTHTGRTINGLVSAREDGRRSEDLFICSVVPQLLVGCENVSL